MLSTLFLIALSQAAAAAPASEPDTVKGPVAMTGAQIKQYNAGLERGDPAYIRCEKILETGSLVKKHTVCRTNAEWRKTHESGNRNARATIEASQSTSIVN
ncbi:MAG: hypothetical protein LC648_05170 [Novosphingobium sp.]|nr:hypothetical protein [Novosphingobium sp.]